MDDTTNDLYWHALNFRTAGSVGAEYMWQELSACVDRLIAAEREACAKVCEEYASRLENMNRNDHPMAEVAATDCADDIRARSNTP